MTELSNSPKVLCLDDEPNILEALERTLRRRFDVIKTETTEEAFKIIEDNPDIAVVISDHILGPMNGVEFLAEVKKKLPNTSRVLLSGQIDVKSMEEAINTAKVHKFIMKPWENEHLVVQLMEANKNHKMLLEREKLHALSITDPVTQLTNHRFFQERVRIDWDKCDKKKRPLSLIMIDIDHFKKYNDRFGHPEGDKILSHVSGVLLEATPEGSSISRYGGEEFSVILPEIGTDKAKQIAENYRQKVLDAAFDNYPLSISLGVATAPEHAQSVDELIICADQALYQAKRRGRNQTIVGIDL